MSTKTDLRTISNLLGDALSQFVKLFQNEVDLAKDAERAASLALSACQALYAAVPGLGGLLGGSRPSNAACGQTPVAGKVEGVTLDYYYAGILEESEVLPSQWSFEA